MLTLLLSVASAWLAADESTPRSPAAERMRVSVAIDYGVAGLPALEGEVEVARGATVVDATHALVPVEQDHLCCNDDDVWSIGGVGPDVRRHAYWSWRLNGRAGPDLPAHYVLAPGDAVQWTFGGAVPKRARAHRVVSLLPAATDILIALGMEHEIAGVSDACALPAGHGAARVATSAIDSERMSMGAIDAAVRAASARREALHRLDEERITAIAPTVVISQGLCPVCAVPPEQAAALHAAVDPQCAPLVVLDARTLAAVAADIRRVGRAVDRAIEGDIVARDFERRIAAMRARGTAQPRPRVAALEWFDPPWIVGDWIPEMIEAAGGDPMLARSSAAARAIAWDELVAADPDVIVLAACSMGVARAQREVAALVAVPQWRELRAVKAGRVVLMDGARHFSSPGPGLARGVELLGEILRDVDRATPPSAADWVRITPH